MPASFQIRPITPTSQPSLLSLNNTNARELSWLEPDGFAALLGKAVYARQIGGETAAETGMLIALDQDAPYINQNFAWFKARYPKFLYVDRIVIGANTRGKGFGRALYEDLFQFARNTGHTLIGCEVNREPPNPQSDAFHATLGFQPVGIVTQPEKERVVTYLVREQAGK